MLVDPVEQFKDEVRENIENLKKDNDFQTLSQNWLKASLKHKYSYNFSWMGRPIIQYPQDIVAMQEIIWSLKPDLIVETGVAHGGSIIFYASMLQLTGKGRIVGVDIDIRSHNRAEIEKHPVSDRIKLIQGSSVDPEIVKQVYAEAEGCKTVLVVLDSNHTHEHVKAELEAYAPLVTSGSYLVVFDTVIEDLAEDQFPDRPWGVGDNPKTAVWEFLKTTSEFEIDRGIQAKLGMTVAPDGYLRRVAKS